MFKISFYLGQFEDLDKKTKEVVPVMVFFSFFLGSLQAVKLFEDPGFFRPIIWHRRE